MPSGLPTPDPSVVCTELSDGAVLFAAERETYFGLNATGLRVWRLLPPVSQSLDALTEALQGDFPEVSRDMLTADTQELLDALAVNGLVVPGTTADAPDATDARADRPDDAR